jgi:hypothetical protein
MGARPQAPAVPPPCGGRTAGASVQPQMGARPQAPAVPPPCGGRTAAGASVQPQMGTLPRAPAVPPPCGGRTAPGGTPAQPRIDPRAHAPAVPPPQGRRAMGGASAQPRMATARGATIQPVMGKYYVESDKELNALHEIAKKYYATLKRGIAYPNYNDDQVVAWGTELVKDAHDGALGILKAAQAILGTPEVAKTRLGDLAGSIDMIKKVIDATVTQLSTCAVNFKALDLADGKEEDEKRQTTAYSVYNKSHITLRSSFYTQDMVARARTIMHETFHIISSTIVHEKDKVAWYHNAYTWESIVMKLAGMENFGQ